MRASRQANRIFLAVLLNLGLALNLSAVCPLAMAAPTTDVKAAKKLFVNAESHFSLGEFEQALDGYKQAYRLKPLPGLLFNMAQCYRKLGDCRSALFYYHRYLAGQPNAKNREAVNELIGVCEKATASRPASQSTNESIAMPPMDLGKKPIEPGAADEEKPDERLTPPEVTIAEHPSAPARNWKPLIWTGVGLTAALLITGTVTGSMALVQSNEYNDPATSVARRRDLKDSGETLAKVATVTFIAAAPVAVATGLLWWYRRHHSDSSASRATSPSVGVSLAPGSAAANLSLQF